MDETKRPSSKALPASKVFNEDLSVQGSIKNPTRILATIKKDGSQLMIKVSKDGDVKYFTKSMKDAQFFNPEYFQHVVQRMHRLRKLMGLDTLVFEYMGTSPCWKDGILETQQNVLVCFEFVTEDGVQHHIYESSKKGEQIREMLNDLENVELVPLVSVTKGLDTLPAMFVKLIGLWLEDPRLEGFMVTFFNGVKFVTVKIKSIIPGQNGAITKNLIRLYNTGKFCNNDKVKAFFDKNTSDKNTDDNKNTKMVHTFLDGAKNLKIPTKENFDKLGINQMFIVAIMILCIMRKRIIANQAKIEVTLDNFSQIINIKSLSQKKTELEEKKERTEEEGRLLEKLKELPLKRQKKEKEKKKKEKTPDGPIPSNIQIIIDDHGIKTCEEIRKAIKALNEPHLMTYISFVIKMKKK